MKNKTVETIIIGGGAAGLGCAHRLTKNKRDFLMITEDIGGRIITSEDGRVNYGAYFVLSNYKHILPYVKKEARLQPFFVDFHGEGEDAYRLLKISWHPIQVLRLLHLLHRFNSTYRKFKYLCEKQSQKQVIRSDPDLHKLYSQSADEYIQEQRIAEIANEYLCQGIYMCTFLPLTEVSAFDFMRLCLALVMPAYEFTFLDKKATESFSENIRFDSVTGIHEGEVAAKNGKVYRAKNIVVATPPHISAELLDLPTIKKGSDAFVFHVSGQLRSEWQDGQFELFKSSSSVIFIRKQRDGSYIFYSKIPDPDLESYFTHYDILFKKYWDPAFNITGKTLLDLEQGNGIYLIGDHNVIGLEDAYISGLLAANRIIAS